MGNDGLPFLQELVGYRDAFVEQAAWVLAQIEDQAMNVVLAQLLQAVFQLLASIFSELLDEDVGDAGLQPDGVFNAAARDFVADDREVDGLIAAFARNHDGDLRAARTFQQVGDLGGGQVVGGLVVHLHDDVARPDARAVGGGAGERRDHHGLAVERPHLHAHAEVVALLVLTQELIIARIEEIGVRVEGAECARDGALIDGFIGIHLVGEVLFHQAVNAGERFQAGADVIAIGDGGSRLDLRSEDAADQRAQKN